MAFRILSRRNHSIKELEEKLCHKGAEPRLIEEVILFLQEYNLLDDEAYARGYIKQRLLQKPMGKKRLALELKQKGIAEDIIQEQMSKIDEQQEYEAALKLASKKMSSGDELDRMKLSAYLWRRGFTSEIISGVCKSLEKYPKTDYS